MFLKKKKKKERLHCLDDFEQFNNTAMLVPNTNTRARCTLLTSVEEEEEKKVEWGGKTGHAAPPGKKLSTPATTQRRGAAERGGIVCGWVRLARF